MTGLSLPHMQLWGAVIAATYAGVDTLSNSLDLSPSLTVHSPQIARSLAHSDLVYCRDSLISTRYLARANHPVSMDNGEKWEKEWSYPRSLSSLCMSLPKQMPMWAKFSGLRYIYVLSRAEKGREKGVVKRVVECQRDGEIWSFPLLASERRLIMEREAYDAAITAEMWRI